MQQSGERVKLHAVQSRKQWSDRMSIVAAMVVVLIWLFASWSAPAAEFLLSANAGALATDRGGLDDGLGSHHLLFCGALKGINGCC